jgi:hypothetical protein
MGLLGARMIEQRRTDHAEAIRILALVEGHFEVDPGNWTGS